MATTHEFNVRMGQKSALRGVHAMVPWLFALLAACAAATAHAVTLPPTVSKSFSPNHVSVGGHAQMTIALHNANFATFTGVAFTDSYPVGMANAHSGVLVSNTCGGTLTADPDGVSAKLVNGVLPHGDCQVVLNVTGTLLGAGQPLTNHTGPVTNDQAFAGADATADLNIDPFTVEKAFSPSSVSVGGWTQMTITLENRAASALTGATFTDSYPTGMANAPSGVVISNTCGGTLTADPNGLSAKLVGGTVPSGDYFNPGTCKVVVNVAATAAGAGQLLTNHTGPVVTDQMSVIDDATADLNVSSAPLMQAPIVTMTALPDSIDVGGIATMMIVVTNPNVYAIAGAQFTMNYPAPVHIVNAPGGTLLDEDLCIFPGGNTTGSAGDAFVSVIGATIPGASSCALFLSVIGTTEGASELHTGPVLSANANPSVDAVSTLTVTNGSLSPAPTLQKAFSPVGVAVGGTAQMTITFANSDPDNAITGVQLEDLYPPGIANASDALVRNTCGGLVLLHPHDGNTDDFHLFDGTIPAGGACSVVVDVIGTIANTGPFNQIGNVQSGNAQTGGIASATLAVTGAALLGAPTVGLSFTPPSVAVGASSKMTITLSNANAFAITGAQFNDLYPDGIANAPNGPLVDTNTCGGTVTADADGDFAALADGTIPPAGAGGTCKVVINVIAKAEGQWVDQTGPIPTANALTGTGAIAGLNVQGGAPLPAPTVSKSFNPDSIAVGAPATMTITLTNNDSSHAITGVQFTDPYPGGMANASSGVVDTNATTCSGTVTAPQNGLSASLANGTIPANSECKVVINVVGTAQGTSENHTGPVDSANADWGADASAILTVGTAGGATPQTVTFTSAPPNNATVAGPTYQATATASSNLPVVLTIDAASTSVCTINGGSVSFIGAGMCTIDANQGGNAVFAPATEKQQTFAVAPAGGGAAQTISFTSVVPNNAKVGGPAYVATATATSGLPVVLTIDVSSVGVCAISGSTVSFVGVGACTIDANQGGDATYAPAPQAQQTFAVAQAGGGAAQTIAFTSVPPANATVGGAQYLAFATATSGLPVTLTIDAAAASVCTINGGTVTFIGAGTCTIDANQGGDATYAAAPQAQQSFAVGSGGGATTQTIAFTSSAPNNAKVAGPTYLVAATATSGLPVSITIDAASDTVCAINNGTVSFIGAGNCIIDANQGGNANFAPAPQMQQAFAVQPANGVVPQAITFTSTAPNNAKVMGPMYVATASSTSGLPVVLTIDASSATVCTINTGTVSFIGPGTCTVDANQGGNDVYAPAPQAHQSFAVASAGGVTPQTITFTSAAPNNAKVAGPAYPASATSTSGLPVVLTIDATSANVCTINNGTVSFIGAGTCKVDANQGGNATYAPAPQIQQLIAVASAGGVTPQSITFTSTAPTHAGVGGPTYLALAIASPSGLPVILTIDASSAAVCTINYGEVSFIGGGTCTIDANQGGNATYAPAPQKQQSFAVSDGSGNHTPIAVGDAIEVAPNDISSALVGDANVPASVLDNDHDADGDSLIAVELSGPAHGDLLQFNPDGTFVYKNTSNAAIDSFTYRACDLFACSPPTTVTITIGTGLDNHLPFATDDAIQVAPHTATGDIVGDAKTTDSVLDNDVDPDGDALTATKLSDPTHGDLVFFNSNGTFSYQNHPNDNATTDTFAYSACDTHGACDLGVVSITIGNAPTDHVPVVVDDAIQVAPGQAASTLIGDLNVPGSVLDNDSDPDAGDTLTAIKVGPLLNNSGTISLNADGTFTYQNTDQQATTDTALYEACDNIFACTAGIVTISINNNPLDNAPIATNDAIIVGPHGSTSMLVGEGTSVLANDTDPGDTLTAHVISAPSNGHVTLNLDGTFTYYNDDPAPGVDSWQYEACDGEGACSAATVSVTIDPNAPTVTCVLPRQVDVVGDTVNLDLSLLFAPPANESLSYSATNLPPSLSVVGSLLTGTLQASDVALSPYTSTLMATTVPAGVSAIEDVVFQVLPTGEILLRDGFDGPGALSQPCQ